MDSASLPMIHVCHIGLRYPGQAETDPGGVEPEDWLIISTGHRGVGLWIADVLRLSIANQQMEPVAQREWWRLYGEGEDVPVARVAATVSVRYPGRTITRTFACLQLLAQAITPARPQTVEELVSSVEDGPHLVTDFEPAATMSDHEMAVRNVRQLENPDPWPILLVQPTRPMVAAARRTGRQTLVVCDEVISKELDCDLQ